MYEQKQIILNGEILNNNVVTNRYFEIIYKISPLIIKNFINIINETPSISKPVRIKKYDFLQINCINIHFKSKVSTGEVQLAYILNKENELVIDTYKLLITEGENKGYFTEMQNNNARLNLKNIVPQEFDISQTQENFIEINNSQSITSAQRIDAEFINSYNIEESLKEDFIPTNIEEKNKTDDFSDKHSVQEHIEEIISAKESIETNESINNININNEKNNQIENNLEDNCPKKTVEISNYSELESQSILEKDIIISKEDFLDINLQDKNKIETLSQEESVYNKILDINKNIVEANKANTLENIDTNSCDNIDNFNFIESQFNNKPEILNTLNIQEIENSIASVKENNSDFNEEKLNPTITKNIYPIEKPMSDDLVDIFDMLPRFIEESGSEKYNKTNEVDDIEIFTKEETEIINKDNIDDKKKKKGHKLNRTEKIALYQNILRGYDNKMTENKLNKFKDSFKSLQRDEKISIEDVLDAQVELLIDNNSKAFRILGDDIKQDVIQIDNELFLSKDKIYTWGDVYLLDYDFD